MEKFLGTFEKEEMHLDTAWKIWLYRLPANEMINANGTRCQAPIRPFRSIKLEMLPKAVKRDFQLHWRPVFFDDGAGTQPAYFTS
jgi:hypothetical protein